MKTVYEERLAFGWILVSFPALTTRMKDYAHVVKRKKQPRQ
jgi:hypothetical protein